MFARILVMLVATVVAVLLAEGSWSLLRGDSLLFPRPFAGQRMLDADRIAAAALTDGPFIVDEDPLTRFHTKPSITRDFFGVPATTDEHGMRLRLGPEIDAEAQRVVVLGDSYVFGFGVEDDQTLSHHLEAALVAAVGTRAARPAVLNVACTGWTFANQLRYLQNHWARLAPDLVVMMPLANDLDDSYSVSETGQPLKLGSEDQPYIGVEQYTTFVIERAKRRLDVLGGAAASDLSWPLQLTDVAPESRRRWDGWIGGIRSIAERFGPDGAAKVFVVHPQNDAFQLVAQRRLTQDLPEVAQFGLLGPRGAGDTLDGDPHPSGRWNRAAAQVIASELIQRGRIEGGDATALPPLEERYREQRLPLRGEQELMDWDRAWRTVCASRIDLDTLQAVQQIYGGVDGDGTVGVSCAMALKVAGKSSVQCIVELLPASSGVARLEIEVYVDGVQCARVKRDPPEEATSFEIDFVLPETALPETARSASREVVDLRIVSRSRVVERRDGTSRLASFRLRSVEAR